MREFSDMSEWIQAAVREVIAAENRQIEEACEAAIQGGQHGVFVQRDEYHRLISAEVHPLVPYGQMYEARGANFPAWFTADD